MKYNLQFINKQAFAAVLIVVFTVAASVTAATAARRITTTTTTTAAAPSRETVRAQLSAARQPLAARAVRRAPLTDDDYFNLGRDFAFALFDASLMDDSEESRQLTIVGLVYLIDRLDAQPEAAPLQKILRAVVRQTASAALVRRDLETISRSFLKRQKADSRWFVKLGTTATDLVIAAYLGEAAALGKNLSEIQSLIKIAPHTADQSMLEPMRTLLSYAAKTVFTEDDYAAVAESAQTLLNAA